MKLKRLVTLTLGVTFHTLASANVYITELHFGSANQEDNIIIANDFIEIYNSADTAVNLNKWQIHTMGGGILTLSYKELEPNSTLLICNDLISAKKDREERANVIFTDRLNIKSNSITLKNTEGITIDSIAPQNAAMGASLHRTGIEIFDGKILNKNQLFETASPSPFVMEHITETTKSAITIRDGEENDRYTVTLKFKKKTLENNDLVDKETDEHINSKETNDDNSEMVLLSPNPVETELNIRITDPELENCSYTIRNASGVTIKKGTITSENIRINMRKHPQGHYILIIEKNGDTYPFKIEKIK